jgi:hypothetical protein
VFEVQQTAAGEWAAVAGGSRVLLVAERDNGRLRDLLSAVRAGFAETLDALVARGLGRTPAFALLDASAETVLLAVRGTASATVAEGDGERVIRATGVSSWVETQLAGAASVTLAGGERSAASEAFPLLDGIVRAAGVAFVPAGVSDDAGATIAAPPRRERETGPVDAVPVDAHPDPIVAGPAVEAFDAADADGPDARTRVPEATLADAPPETSGYDHLFGATMVRSVEDAAVRPAEEDAPARIDLPGFITDSFPPSAGGPAGDHDGLTVLSGDLPRRADAPEAAAPAPEPVPARPSFAVLLSDGRREPLTAPMVVGRAPSVSAVPSLHGARPVTLTSAEDDISRSHVAVAVEGDSVVVTDLHSRNGTMIVLPGASPQKLRSGEPTTVVLGTVIDLGSGATLTVEAAG